MKEEQIVGVISAVMEKGFGFIEVEGYEENVFFHASDCADVTFDELKVGSRVSMDKIEKNSKGHCASAVSLVADSSVDGE